MYKTFNGENNSETLVNNETATGSVELTIRVKDHELYAQLTNGELMSLAMSLLECVEYSRY